MSTKVRSKTKKSAPKTSSARGKTAKKTLKVVAPREEEIDDLDDEEDDFDDEEDEEDEVEEASFQADDSEDAEGALEEGGEAQETALAQVGGVTDTSGFDIIEEFANPLMLKGTPVYLWFSRNGMTLGRKDLPYSLDQMLREYGPGVYKIFVKDAATHRVLRQQTIPMGLMGSGQAIAPSSEVKPAVPVDPMGIVALMQENQQAAKREMAEQTTKDKDVLGALMQSMMQSQLAQGQQTQQFMQMMVTQQMQVMEKINSSSQQMFQLIQGQISAMTSKQTEKPLSAIELITMLEKTKASSVEQYEAMLERIESKASDKAEILERIESLARKEPAEKPSSFDRMIELLAPVVGQIAAAQAAASQGAAAPQPALPVKEEPRPPTQVLPREAPKVTVPKAAPGFEAPPGLRPAPGFPRIEKSETSKTVAPESLNGKHGPKEVVSSVLPTPAQKPAEPSGAGAKA